VSLGWPTPSYPRDTSNHVEVSLNADTVLIRDDKYAGEPVDEPIIAIPASMWADFLAIVANEDLADATTVGIPAIIREFDGTTVLRDSRGQTLIFTPGEWSAFRSGVRAGEFTPATA
jgi:hypothetical protein